MDFDLNASINELADALADLTVQPKHAFSDFIIACLATDVLDAAQVTQSLANTALPHAAFPNARRAYETAIEMQILTADFGLYDERCARLRVFELFEAEVLSERGRGLPGVSPSAEFREAVERIVIQEAKEWDLKSEGQGIHLRRAWEVQSKLAAARPLHWSGTSQLQCYAEAMGTDVRADSYIWATLSMETHARARTGGRVVKTVNGRMTLVANEADRRKPSQIADLACDMAKNALEFRRRWAGA